MKGTVLACLSKSAGEGQRNPFGRSRLRPLSIERIEGGSAVDRPSNKGCPARRNMKKEYAVLFLCFALLLVESLLPNRAAAVLGGAAGTVESDREAMAGSAVTTDAHLYYTIHQFAYGGAQLREYVSPSGVVFALAWNGLTHPDLEQLLGSYTGAHEEAVARTPRRHGVRRMRVEADGVIVEKWGHMRNLQGRAYISDLIPEGVTIDEIR